MYNFQWWKAENNYYRLKGIVVVNELEYPRINEVFALIKPRGGRYQVTCYPIGWNPHWLIKKENGSLTKQQSYDTLEEAKTFAEQFTTNATITNE
jgi:hypothetical protein